MLLVPLAFLVLLLGLLGAGGIDARAQGPVVDLRFEDTELAEIVEAVSAAAGERFIFDSTLKGRVTIDVAGGVTAEESLEILGAALQMKGFAMVEGPHGFRKIIPTSQSQGQLPWLDRTPDAHGERLVLTLVRLQSADAEEVLAVLKPLVRQTAVALAYPATNSLILGATEGELARLLEIVDSLDPEQGTQLVVLRLKHRSAENALELVQGVLGDVEPPRPAVELWANEFSSSLIVRGSSKGIDRVRELLRKIDRPQAGQGRIHIHRVSHADAEELAQILQQFVGGAPQPAGRRRSAAQRRTAQAQRAAISELEEDIAVGVDPPTNSLVIRSSAEAYGVLREVIEELDRIRPQVLIEALILNVEVSETSELGFSGLIQIERGDSTYRFTSLMDLVSNDLVGQVAPPGAGSSILANLVMNDTGSGTLIQGIVRAAASDGYTEVVSSPTVLTLDNEEAEIRTGNNIPIPVATTDAAQTTTAGLSTNLTIERQDIGTTLRVTPQISEGDTLRLDIFQELTDVNNGLTEVSGGALAVGVSLRLRRSENTVLVGDGETVAIAGLISERYDDTVQKVPFLGDIPLLGVFFRNHSKILRKTNLLVFITPHIVRSPEDLERQRIRQRQEFDDASGGLSD